MESTQPIQENGATSTTLLNNTAQNNSSNIVLTLENSPTNSQLMLVCNPELQENEINILNESSEIIATQLPTLMLLHDSVLSDESIVNSDSIQITSDDEENDPKPSYVSENTSTETVTPDVVKPSPIVPFSTASQSVEVDPLLLPLEIINNVVTYKEQNNDSQDSITTDVLGAITVRNVTNCKRKNQSIPAVKTCQKSKEIRLAIMDRTHTDTPMTQQRANLFKRKLSEAMDAAFEKRNIELQFTKNIFANGVLWVTCANKQSAEWLKVEVSKFEYSLTFPKAKKLPERFKVSVFVPKPVEQVEVVRKRLGKQNSNLKMGSWFLVNIQAENKGQVLSFSIDEESFKFLKKSQFKAYYRLEMVQFQVLEELEGSNSDRLTHK